MTPFPPAIALLLATAAVLPARGADDDALDLQADPPAAAASAAGAAVAPALRLALEAAGLHANRRGGLGAQGGHRLAIDLRWSGQLAPSWRFGLSNRLDDLHPAQPGQRNTRNSLREAYFGWQSDNAASSIELGRVNLRHGPGYGYNPTDYLRRGATRIIVSADPVALRENRLGTFMLRGSQLWQGGGAAITWAPKLTNRGPSDKALSLDLGTTNAHQRVLLSANARASERWSGEALALVEAGGRNRLGLNFTGLMTDWAVLHGEFSSGKTNDLLQLALGQAVPLQRVQQATLGATFSLPGGLSLTAEAQYNGAGLDRQGWQQLFARGPAAAGGLLAATQADQELAARHSLLVYATQKSAFLKQLDITGFVRHSPLDHSSLAWIELRYHWPHLDTAVQWQRSLGGQATEYGALPYRQVFQLVGTLYF